MLHPMTKASSPSMKTLLHCCYFEKLFKTLKSENAEVGEKTCSTVEQETLPLAEESTKELVNEWTPALQLKVVGECLCIN
ncbi:hypothetical protein TSMEX_010640 [Taenia solium]|eukprot:TsM_000466100 transcript=TsM_000466100 gene=TsM_000466100